MNRRSFLQGLCKIVGKKPLDGYQQVEYIRSVDGNQYINTGYYHNSSTKYELELEFPAPRFTSEQYPKILGSDRTGSVGRFGVEGAGRSFNFRRLAATYAGSWLDYDFGPIVADRKYKLRVLNNLSESWYADTLNGRGTNSNVSVVSSGKTDYLFAMNGATEKQTIIKLYYCKIYENDVLVRDFVPCYRKSDNEVGLYDTVTKQFYTNQGTGTFLKGPDV